MGHPSRRKFTWTVKFDALFAYGRASPLRPHDRYFASSQRPENLVRLYGLVRIVGFSDTPASTLVEILCAASGEGKAIRAFVSRLSYKSAGGITK
jgi:hypothetical protein